MAVLRPVAWQLPAVGVVVVDTKSTTEEAGVLGGRRWSGRGADAMFGGHGFRVVVGGRRYGEPCASSDREVDEKTGAERGGQQKLVDEVACAVKLLMAIGGPD